MVCVSRFSILRDNTPCFMIAGQDTFRLASPFSLFAFSFFSFFSSAGDWHLLFPSGILPVSSPSESLILGGSKEECRFPRGLLDPMPLKEERRKCTSQRPMGERISARSVPPRSLRACRISARCCKHVNTVVESLRMIEVGSLFS